MKKTISLLTIFLITIFAMESIAVGPEPDIPVGCEAEATCMNEFNESFGTVSCTGLFDCKTYRDGVKCDGNSHYCMQGSIHD